uniref:G-protein coupled receptors family 1 profile domain-containing protein n=1 Tax=Plectus sambesii TaxID=2011161 RepID=A0A914WLN1_9BILA
MSLSVDLNASLPSCNYNTDLYSKEQLAIRTFALVPIVIFGVVSNVINIAIFCQKQLRAMLVNWFLLAMSISDLLLLVCSFCMFSLPALAEMWNNVMVIEFSLSVMRWLYPFGTMVQTFNVYLTVLISINRYLGVCHPFRARTWVSKRAIGLSIWSALVFAVSFNATRFAEMRLIDCWSHVYSKVSTIMSPSPLLANRVYFVGYYVAAYSVVMFVIPFPVLIVATVLIITTLRAASVRRKKIAGGQSQRTLSQSEQNEISTTLMLLAVVGMFLSCNLFAFVNNVVDIFIQFDIIESPTFKRYFTTLIEVGNLMVAVNSAATIFIYVSFSSGYRTVFYKWFKCQKRLKPITQQQPEAENLLSNGRRKSLRCRRKMLGSTSWPSSKRASAANWQS